MNKIFLVLILASTSLIFSCKDESESKNNSINTIEKKYVTRDSILESYVTTINEIQDNLDSIKSKEKIINNNSKDISNKTTAELILDDLATIDNYMATNKQKMELLKSKIKSQDTSLNKSNALVVSIYKLFERANKDLELRDMELGDIKDHLGKINTELKNMTNTINEKTKESSKKTIELNTAYYAIGTEKELLKKGIITGEGGFIGIGKSMKMNTDFIQNYFRKINIKVNTTIDINSKSAKLITVHPNNSYKIVGTKKHVDSIEITNNKDFWAASKFLVILVSE